MDQIKKILTILNKYQFWVVFVIVLATSIVCFWIATAGLADQFAARKGKINSAFNSATVQPEHPNQKVIDSANQQTQRARQNVFESWKLLYDEQKQKNPFPEWLDEGFKKQFENLKPEGELDREYRRIYQNKIQQYLPRLLTIVDARDPTEENPQDETTQQKESIGSVEWKNYSEIIKDFSWEYEPSTLAVVLAQEDLWVYEALLQVIKKTNEGTSGPASVPVKTIDALKIGKYVAQNASRGVMQPSSGGEGAMEGMPAATQGGTAAEQERQTLMNGRYVGENGQPMPDQGESSSEFKMMPFRMELVIDQRRLPNLLAECADSSMPIQVSSIYIQKLKDEAVSMSPSTSPSSSGRSGGSRSRSAAQGRESQSAAIRQGAEGEQEPRPYDVALVLEGAIYIYNPPDLQKLGIAASDQNAEGNESSTDAAEPGN